MTGPVFKIDIKIVPGLSTWTFITLFHAVCYTRVVMDSALRSGRSRGPRHYSRPVRFDRSRPWDGITSRSSFTPASRHVVLGHATRLFVSPRRMTASCSGLSHRIGLLSTSHYTRATRGNGEFHHCAGRKLLAGRLGGSADRLGSGCQTGNSTRLNRCHLSILTSRYD